MIYLKPLVKKLTKDKSIIFAISVMGSDEEIVEYLEENGFSREKIFSSFENYYGFKYVDLTNIEINNELLKEFDIQKSTALLTIPYKVDRENKIYYFATSDLSNQRFRDVLESVCKDKGYNVDFRFAFKTAITDKYKQLEKEPESYIHQEETSIINQVKPLGVSKSEASIQDDGLNAELWVDSLLNEAIFYGSSDLHLERLREGLQVRFRIDGKLTKKSFFNLNPSDIKKIFSRIKIMSSMDESEWRKPQDGRISDYGYRTKEKVCKYDMRVSFINTIYKGKIVIRFFDKDGDVMTFDKLGFPKKDAEKIKRMIRNKNGILFLAGATGSGKTTTLYTMIEDINSDDINIYTIEDPIEKTIVNVNQIEVEEEAGVTFKNTLSSLLRQDPDVIVVGEVRDPETANLSITSSLTGHLVLTTIHANNAIDTINRLYDMGIEPYMLGSSSLGFMSQRLVRTLCPHCKEKVEKLEPGEDAWIKHITHENNLGGYEVEFNDGLYRAVGCDKCHDGYKGRIAIAEIVEVTNELKSLISKGASIDSIREKAIEEGYEPMIVNGFKLVKEGKTSINEIMANI